jgi:ABC-type Zn uptake system ZnuABC Zn-binding protein ZnuA
MKRTTLKLLVVSALAVSGFLASIAHAGEPIPVVASFSILGDLVKVVGGDLCMYFWCVMSNPIGHESVMRISKNHKLINLRIFDN